MRIPNNNWLSIEYLKLLGLEKDLEKFEQVRRMVQVYILCTHFVPDQPCDIPSRSWKSTPISRLRKETEG